MPSCNDSHCGGGCEWGDFLQEIVMAMDKQIKPRRVGSRRE